MVKFISVQQTNENEWSKPFQSPYYYTFSFEHLSISVKQSLSLCVCLFVSMLSM